MPSLEIMVKMGGTGNNVWNFIRTSNVMDRMVNSINYRYRSKRWKCTQTRNAR